MMYILVAIFAFSLGWIGGSWFRGTVFDNLDWQCLRWNPDSFGYRPAPTGSRLMPHDKLIMGLKLDSTGWPEEGIVLDADEP
tara:strand:- start:5719 stop:5964 length:246 start_codon:yes stop_codon:yes gene_type:complete